MYIRAHFRYKFIHNQLKVGKKRKMTKIHYLLILCQLDQLKILINNLVLFETFFKVIKVQQQTR